MDTITEMIELLRQHRETVMLAGLFVLGFLLLTLPFAAWRIRRWTRRTFEETRATNARLDELIRLAGARSADSSAESDPFAEYATKKWTFRTFEETRELNAKLERLIELAEAAQAPAAPRSGTR